MLTELIDPRTLDCAMRLTKEFVYEVEPSVVIAQLRPEGFRHASLVPLLKNAKNMEELVDKWLRIEVCLVSGVSPCDANAYCACLLGDHQLDWSHS